jgi:hypothetical protein
MFTRLGARTFMLAIVVLGPGALAASADSASAPLSVGVTVVRSCSVTATPAAPQQATVHVKCTDGARAALQTPPSATVPTTPFRGSETNNGIQVVTLNF